MAKPSAPLQDAKKYMNRLIDERKRSDSKSSKSLLREIKELEEERSKLVRECAELEFKVEELDRKTSASSEARKMYGDVTSGDTTHQDVVLSYQSHFQNAHRDLPKVFNAQTKEAKFEEWKRASKIVEQSFDENKEEIISEMIKKLKIALETPPPTDKPLDSSTSDLYKAFTVYLKKNKSEILNDDEVEQFIDIPQECGTKDYELAMAYFARDVIINLDPEDYHSFIVEGRKRPKNYPQEASGSAEAISKAKIEAEKKSKCHACKKRFELDKGESPTYHLGYYWHPFHYRCFSCHKEVDKDFLYYKNNRSSYCSCCYCWGCNKPIGGDKAVVTKQLQGQYHKKCLTVLC